MTTICRMCSLPAGDRTVFITKTKKDPACMRILPALFACLISGPLFSQSQIRFDSTGKVLEAELIHYEKNAPDVTVAITIDKPQPKIEAIRKLLLAKVENTLTNLEDQHSSYSKFYKALWGPDVLRALQQELESLKSYLETPASGVSYSYLPSPATYFDPLFVHYKPETYFLINKQTFASSFPLQSTEYVKASNAFKVELYYKDPLKDLLLQLYDDTYTAAGDMAALRQMGRTEFYTLQPEMLTGLRQRLQHFLSIKPEAYTQPILDSIDQLHGDVTGNTLYQLFKDGLYFKKWIWWREGEPAIYPFELAAADTAKTVADKAALKAARNVVLTEQVAMATSKWNSVLVPVKADNKEQLHYSAQPLESVPDYTKLLSDPFGAEDNIAVFTHNLLRNEAAALRETKAEALKAQNNFIQGVDSAAGMIAALMGVLKPQLGTWGKVFQVLNPMPRVDGPGHSLELNEAYDGSKSAIQKGGSVTKKQRKVIQQAVLQDLKKFGAYNPYFFQQVVNSLETHDYKKNPIPAADYRRGLLKLYEDYFKLIIGAREQLQEDSLVVTNLHAVLVQSNLPPKKIQPTIQEVPVYRTELHHTGKKDEEVRRYFTLVKYTREGGKITDSATLASFDYKVGRRYLFLASAGIGYTIPSDYYGLNKVETATDGSTRVTTKSDRVRLVAGLHIYPTRIFLRDNRWGKPKKYPLHTRFSLFAGLGIPDPLQNYYPGVSYDPVPGLKLIAGPHLYRYTRYKTENNVVTKESSDVKYAGTYLSLNIDPAVLVKALGLFQ